MVLSVRIKTIYQVLLIVESDLTAYVVSQEAAVM